MARKKSPKHSPAAVAEAAGCSPSLAHRLLTRGMTREQIVARCEQRRKAEAARRKVNGHAANVTTIPPFAISQAKKEFALAELRGLEVEIKRGTLVRLEPLRSVCFAAAQYLSVRFSSLPDELRQEFGPQFGQGFARPHPALFRRGRPGVSPRVREAPHPDGA
jgi:hypothetical protein